MRKRPLSGAIIGILIGEAIAVILARQGIWPPDQLTVFLLPAVIGLLGLALLSIGRTDSTTTMVIALIILTPMAIWGALGLGDIDQNGELNGGCTVTATSTVDDTTVIDTSRSDPFEIEADGALSWTATSPQAFTDYEWEINVVVGGIPIPIESDTEANTAGDTENGGEVDDVRAYAGLIGLDLDLYVGVYEVGGYAASCDGFGFVRIIGDGLDVVTVIAAFLVVLLIILLVIVYYAGRSKVTTETAAIGDEGPDLP